MMSGSDIFFTTAHVITEWPIRYHMNWDLTQRSHTAICFPLCPRIMAARSWEVRTGIGCEGTFRSVLAHQQRSRSAINGPDGKRLIIFNYKKNFQLVK
ncbi:unnamed protein product, partial [Staurois parvus]